MPPNGNSAVLVVFGSARKTRVFPPPDAEHEGAADSESTEKVTMWLRLSKREVFSLLLQCAGAAMFHGRRCGRDGECGELRANRLSFHMAHPRVTTIAAASSTPAVQIIDAGRVCHDGPAAPVCGVYTRSSSAPDRRLPFTSGGPLDEPPDSPLAAAVSSGKSRLSSGGTPVSLRSPNPGNLACR